MIRINENYLKLQSSYLFSTIDKKVASYCEANPEKRIIKLGIGDINWEQFLKLFDDSIELSYQPADPKGLVLWDIKYDDHLKFRIDLKSSERLKNYFLIQECKYAHKQQLFKILQQNDFS